MNLHQKRTHPEYVEGCFGCKAGSLHLAYTGINGSDATAQKHWDRELDEYRAAVAQGMQPESTKTKDIRAAVAWSDKHQVAYSDETATAVRWDRALEEAA